MANLQTGLQPNDIIVNAVRDRLGGDYNSRIPLATKNNMADVADSILNDRNVYNAFTETMINLIGNIIIRESSFKNPLAVFKTDVFRTGQTIEEVGVELLRAKPYNMTDNIIFERNLPSVLTRFHPENRKVHYDITVNDVEIARSFRNDYGLNSFITNILGKAQEANEKDELLIMSQLLRIASKRAYNIKIEMDDPIKAPEEIIKQLTKYIMAYRYELCSRPQGDYNFAGLNSTVSQLENMVLVTSNDVLASIKTEVLAAAFNIDQIESGSPERVIRLSKKDMPTGVHAILCDASLIVAGDSLRTVQSFYNPKNLETNFYYHVRGGFALSDFGQIVTFSNNETTLSNTVRIELSGITAELFNSNGAVTTTVKPGEKYNLEVSPSGSTTDPDVPLRVSAGQYKVDITSSDKANLNQAKTYVDSNGSLHVGDNVKKGTTIYLDIKSAYINSETGETAPYNTQLELTVE